MNKPVIITSSGVMGNLVANAAEKKGLEVVLRYNRDTTLNEIKEKILEFKDNVIVIDFSVKERALQLYNLASEIDFVLIIGTNGTNLKSKENVYCGPLSPSNMSIEAEFNSFMDFHLNPRIITIIDDCRERKDPGSDVSNREINLIKARYSGYQVFDRSVFYSVDDLKLCLSKLYSEPYNHIIFPVSIRQGKDFYENTGTHTLVFDNSFVSVYAGDPSEFSEFSIDKGLEILTNKR